MGGVSATMGENVNVASDGRFFGAVMFFMFLYCYICEFDRFIEDVLDVAGSAAGQKLVMGVCVHDSPCP